MTTFLDLPGELRNGIYDAVLNINRTIKLSENGRVVQPSISRANRQIRLEFDSLFSGLTSKPQNIEAQVSNFDFRGLHDFFHKNSCFFDNHPHEAKVVVSMTEPGSESTHFDILDDWLQVSAARGWNVKYQVEYDWRNYSLSEANTSAQVFASRFDPLNTASPAGKMLQRALCEARAVKVRQELVQRPGRFMRRGDVPRSDRLRAFFMRD
ncbi:hypothetical protein AMS68_001448 [Peltaster fructicola]|uniref:Uncharacterized protein n=1 Tax=Peltaster fructicola TaxID=286661 RepID=A0A6H0XMR3_9PEZI|nr:hypothetical protein AMS68_001448 [Peltaster fructicola]